MTRHTPIQALSLALAAAVLMAAAAPAALAQGQQVASFGTDISVGSGWQDLAAAYPPMTSAPAWVANKSAFPVLVAFTSSANAPGGGGAVLAPNAAPLYGNATHVWVKSLGGGSTVSVGLAGAQPVTDSTLAALISANAAAPIPSQSAHGVLVGAVEGTGSAGAPSAYVLSVQGVNGGTALPVSLTSLPAFAATPTVNVGTMPAVSGTVTANAGSGTFAVSASALPLPAGAATDAHLTNVQSALGTAATTAITVQGSPTGVPQPVSGSVALSGTLPAFASAPAVTASANSSGAIALVQSDSSAPINVGTATTTQLVALVSGKSIYVTGWDIVVAAADTISLEYGTGTACGTGTTALTGAYNFPANGGLATGSGLGVLFKIPAGNALCIVTSAATQASGRVSYAQF